MNPDISPECTGECCDHYYMAIRKGIEAVSNATIRLNLSKDEIKVVRSKYFLEKYKLDGISNIGLSPYENLAVEILANSPICRKCPNKSTV